MIPLLMVLQALVTLWLAVSCRRYAVRAAEANADLWQGLAKQRMDHDALADATVEAFEAIDDRFAELEPDAITVAPPPRCNCPNCRKRRQMAVN